LGLFAVTMRLFRAWGGGERERLQQRVCRRMWKGVVGGMIRMKMISGSGVGVWVRGGGRLGGM
jgi:hypothetical protein